MSYFKTGKEGQMRPSNWPKFLPNFSVRPRMDRGQGVNNSKGGGWMKLKVEKLEEKIAPAGISQGGQLFMLPPG
jgi:hypothetical protein